MARHHSGRGRDRRPLRCEPLEDRRILAVITVDAAADVVDFNDGLTSLREAIFAANAVPGADEIVFSDNLFAHGSAAIVLTQGELVVSEALAVTGPGPELLTIDASGSDPTPSQNNQDGSRVFSVPSASAPLELRGMTIAGGDVAGAGGGVRSLGELTLDECVLAENSASSFGGGALAVKLTARDCAIDGNTVIKGPSSGAGGGLYAVEMVLERSDVRNNTSHGSGGGLHADQRLAVRDSVISGNTAFKGGGGASAGGEVEMTGVLVESNRAERGTSPQSDGGGIYLVAGGNVTITNSTFANNFAAYGGGAIASNPRTNRLTLLHSTVSGNMASTDSGIRGGGVTVRHSTVVNNGIVGASGALVTGGGVSGLSVTLDHSIVAGNSVLPSGHYDVRGNVTTRWSVVGNGRNTGLPEAPIGSPDANGNLIGGQVHGEIDPKLGPLADNGGPALPGGYRMLTHRPLAGSPVIDAGDAALEAGVGETPAFDQRGAPFSRVVGARIDIGAVEAIGAPIVVDTLVDESDGNFSKGDLSLREAIELANAQPGAETIVFDAALFAGRPGTILLTRGELRVTGSTTITGPGATLLTIDASGNDPTPDLKNGDGSRVLLIDDETSIKQIVTIRGVVLEGGDVRGSGGAVLARESLTLEQLGIQGNSATDPSANPNGINIGAGGAVYSTVSLTLRDSIVTGNRGGFGGGLYINGTAVIVRSEISHNTSFGMFGAGGGILGRGPNAIAISHSSLHHNSAIAGSGGLRSEGGVVTIVSTVVSNNDGGTVGGGLGVRGGRLNLVGSTIADNVAAHGGGGIWLNNGFGHDLRDSTISGNTADRSGGGLYLERVSQLTVARLTITGNRADADAALALGNGGGIFGLAQGVVVTQTIVAGNSIGTGATPSDVVGNFASASLGNVFRNSLIGYTTHSSLAEAPLGSPDARGNLIGGSVNGAIDPLLGPLADNGGPVLPGGAKLLTHAPLPGSPVIDAGDPALVPGAGGVPEFDQRGAPYSRLTGSRVDMGAVELQASGGALSGDFNLDRRVDGSDFLAWQRGLGRTGVVTIRHGDATADGDVDANDLAVWKARAWEAVSYEPSAVSQREGESSVAARAADAVFAVGDFSRLFAVSEAPSAARGKYRQGRRV
jgi:CSLREA domain-containing protein